jgi:hypothetical protein
MLLVVSMGVTSSGSFLCATTRCTGARCSRSECTRFATVRLSRAVARRTCCLRALVVQIAFLLTMTGSPYPLVAPQSGAACVALDGMVNFYG